MWGIDHFATPRMTDHARERCAEMGLSTKTAKQIFRHPTLVVPKRDPRSDRMFRVSSDLHPQYAIIVCCDVPAEPVVVTVLFDVNQAYVRRGETYLLVKPRKVSEHRPKREMKKGLRARNSQRRRRHEIAPSVDDW